MRACVRACVCVCHGYVVHVPGTERLHANHLTLSSLLPGTQGSAIPLQDLNVGYGSTSDPPSSSEQQVAQAAGEEDSNDGCSQAPVTPQRAHEINPGELLGIKFNVDQNIYRSGTGLR